MTNTMNNQPAQNDKDSYIKQFVKRWMDGHEPDTFVKDTQGNVLYTAGHSTLNLIAFFEDLLEEYITDCEVTLQPAPKSAEWSEVCNCKQDDRIGSTWCCNHCGKPDSHSTPPRYVPDEEIDAMWPEGSDAFIYILQRRNVAKAMRDKIFGGVKP